MAERIAPPDPKPRERRPPRGHRSGPRPWLLSALLGLGLAIGACGPALPPPSRVPTALPPQPPPTAPTCGAAEYLRGGRWTWSEGTWRWEPPVCAPRPPSWRDGCVWERGRWSRPASGAPLAYREGRLACP